MSIDEDDIEWPTGLEGVQNYQLVDELIKRGWTEGLQGRIGGDRVRRMTLIAPHDYDSQSTRRSQ